MSKGFLAPLKKSEFDGKIAARGWVAVNRKDHIVHNTIRPTRTESLTAILNIANPKSHTDPDSRITWQDLKRYGYRITKVTLTYTAS